MKIFSIKEVNSIKEPLAIIYRDSSIGDIVACEPIIERVINKFNLKIGWVVNVKFVSILKFHPRIDYLFIVNNRDEAWDSLKILDSNKIPVLLYMRPRDKETLKKYGNVLKVNPAISARTYYNHGGLLELFSKAAGLPTGKVQPRFYLDPNVNVTLKDKNGKQVQNYICIHCRSNKDDYGRDWDDQKWNDLVEYFISKSTYVVEIGLKSIVKSKSRFYIDMTNERDLQKIAQIINGCNFFIGIDSGFAHIANALEKDGVCLVGKIRGIFYYHTPFTGKYQYKGILRAPKGMAAFHLRCSNVIEFYEKYNDWFYMAKIKLNNWIARNIIQNLAIVRNYYRRNFR